MNKEEKNTRSRSKSRGRRSRGGTLGTILIIFGIIIFTSAWWVPQGSEDTAAYIIGFITVLIGIGAPAFLSPRD